MALIILICFLAIGVVNVRAGSLTPSSAPAASGYTLGDIYTRLSTNASAIAGNHNLATTTSPAGTFYTLTQIYNAIPAIDATKVKLGIFYLGVAGTLTPDGGTAAVADLFNGKTANLTADWNLDTGTLNLACNTATFNGVGNLVADGYDGAGNGANRWCMATSTNSAAAGDILSGKNAWVNGAEIAGSILTKTGNNVVTVSATSTNQLLLTPPIGYYDGATTISTTSTVFDPANIKSGAYLFGLVGTLTSLLYGDNNADQVLTTASSPGSIAVITGNTAVASSSIQGTSFVLTVPQGYYSGAASVTVSTSSVNMFINQKNQTIDDWVNSGGTIGEYINEEATWAAVSGSPFATTSISYSPVGSPLSPATGAVKQDTRTGLWWTDAMAIGATASSTTNIFILTGVAGVGDGTRPTDGNAIGFCNALNTANFSGNNNWYLPTQKELMQAYIDGSANNLPNAGNFFWSSTETYSNTANAWFVFLYYGYTYYFTKTSSYYVRCVRRP